MKKFYSLCLALSVSGLVAMPLQAAQGEMMSIFTEDFSAFTEGSAEAPAEEEEKGFVRYLWSLRII